MVCLSYRMHWEARNLQAWTLNLNTNTMLVSQTNGTTNVPYRCVYPHNYFLTPPPHSDWPLHSFYPHIHTANSLLLSYFFICDDGMSVHVSQFIWTPDFLL